ncbi:hypothetical protein ACFL2K_03040 [Candidatus Margulisiibacteriota bacterium]
MVKKAQLSNIGIIILDSQIIITKSKNTITGYKIQDYYVKECKTGLTEQENLDLVLSEIPKTFFDNSKVVFALPCHHVLFKKIKLPELSPREFQLALRNSIEEPEKFCWDYFFTQERINSEGAEQDIFTIKAETIIVNSFIDIFEKHKIELDNITVKSSVFHSIFNQGEDKKQPLIFAIDLEKELLKIYILKNGKPLFFRVVPYGYLEIIKVISGKIEKDGKKIECDTDSTIKLLAENDIFNPDQASPIPLEQLFFLVRPVLEKMVIEIKKSIQFFLQEDESTNIDAAYIIGDFLKVKNIKNYFSEQLGMVVQFPSFAKQEKIKKADNALPALISAINFAALVGRDGQKERGISLLPQYYREKKIKKTFVLSFATSLVLWLLILVFFFIKYADMNTRLRGQIYSKKNELQEIIKRRNLIRQKKNINEEKTNRILFVDKIDKERLPLEDLLYRLNSLDSRNIKLTNLAVDKNEVVIKGQIKQANSSALISNYIDGIAKIPYISEVKFEVKHSGSKEAVLVIKAKISGMEIAKK